MSATATAPSPPLARRGGPRKQLARLERPLAAGGLVLVTAHLLDLAISGPDTAILGVLSIVAARAFSLTSPRCFSRS